MHPFLPYFDVTGCMRLPGRDSRRELGHVGLSLALLRCSCWEDVKFAHANNFFRAACGPAPTQLLE